MPLPASGNSISLDQIHVELGENSGTTVALGDDDVRGLASDTSGAIGMDQFFGLSNASNIEDVFHVQAYYGNESSKAFDIGLNLSGDGGLVWFKHRSNQGDNNALIDTVRGTTKVLASNSSAVEETFSGFSSFNDDGFTINTADHRFNESFSKLGFWAWKKQAGFFDIVTYTGNDSTGTSQNISHNLGIVPGMIIVKARDKTENFTVWHSGAVNASAGNTSGSYLDMSSTSAAAQSSTMWNNTNPTSSVFSVGNNGATNDNGTSYVAYLFGHQANDDDAALISCGSYTGNGVSLSDSSAFKSVDIGFEPQFLMIKSTVGSTGNWIVLDKARGFATYKQNGSEEINWNLSTDLDDGIIASPTGSGFDLVTNRQDVNGNGNTYVYMAIRNGPMAAPTAGSQILSMDTLGSHSFPNNLSNPFYDSAHPVDMAWQHSSGPKYVFARKLHTGELTFGATGHTGSSNEANFDFPDGYFSGSGSSFSYMFHEHGEAFSTQSYRGTGSNRTVKHKLGVAPELLVIKNFSQSDNWAVYYGDNTDHLHFNSVSGTADDNTYWNDTSPTSSVFTVGTHHDVNASNEFYFAFMFATVAGVTKVGTVNVTGATDVDCGFSSGSRFVMIKRYSGNGHWIVFDTTSGLVAGNDSYRKMDHNSAAVTNADVVDPLNAGFSLTADFLNITNNGSGDYVFLAIAA